MSKRPRDESLEGVIGLESSDLIDWLGPPTPTGSSSNWPSNGWLSPRDSPGLMRAIADGTANSGSLCGAPTNADAFVAGLLAGEGNGEVSATATATPIRCAASIASAPASSTMKTAGPNFSSLSAQVPTTAELETHVASLPSHYALTTSAADRSLHCRLILQLRAEGALSPTVVTAWMHTSDSSGSAFRLHAIFRDRCVHGWCWNHTC